MTDTGWVPAFPRQREPFREGNLAAVTNGARSRRKVEELASRIDDELAERAPWVLSYPEALSAYARAESISRLIYNDLARNGIYDKNGQFRASLISRWSTAENVAARQRAELGLTPKSEAEVARDRATAAAVAQSADLADLAARGRAAREARAVEVATATRIDDISTDRKDDLE
ncbi:MAG: hypothetical protein ABUL47_05715 [Leifsonia sp.]